MKTRTLLAPLLSLLCLPATAQIPNTLLHAIPSPVALLQPGGELGSSVAVNATFTAVGVPKDDIGETDCGVTKVFNTATGALLFVLTNPEPGNFDFFGSSVALEGSILVVGAPSFDGGAYVYDLSGATPTVPVYVLTRPGTNDSFGISVAISGSRVVVGASRNNTGAPLAGAAFVYDLSGGTPAVPVFTLNNPTPVNNDQFGNSVSISGVRVLVGAQLDDTGAVDAGSAYVYDLSSGTPTVPIHTLNKPGPVLDDRFGASVSISGAQLVVGAPRDDTGGLSAGTAYVYDLGSATPTVPLHTLNNGLPTPAGDQLGVSVCISGNRVIVGLNQEDTGASNAGSALVYDLTSGTPTVPVLVLNNPSAAADDSFGRAVTINGTLAAVGAPQDDAGILNAGSAYVYNVTSGAPTVPVQTLNNPGILVSERFGNSVALSGSLMVVGANAANLATQDAAGLVLVFNLGGATPTVPVLTLAGPVGAGGGSQFGFAVAVSGTRIVVGAPFDDTAGTQTGSAFVFDMSSGTPAVPVFTLPNPAPASLDFFGVAVAISGTRVVIGASSDNAGATDSGTAYVYDLSSGTPTVPAFTLDNPTPATNDNFGAAVAISGTRVVVGAEFDDTTLADAGIAYVYDLTSGTPTLPVLTLNNPVPFSSERFGSAVAIDGARVVIGVAADRPGGGPNFGGAHVYDLTSGTPTVPIVNISNPAPLVNDDFGASVSISGTLVVIGALNDDAGATNSGTAYVYNLASGAPSSPAATLNNPTPFLGDQFAVSVSISGSTVVVGAPFDDTALFDKGAAYVFVPGIGPAPVASALGDVVTGAFAPNAAGANDGTKYDVLRRGGYLAENGNLIFPGNLLVGTGGVILSPNNFMGLWKQVGASLTRFARSGGAAPEASGALFDVLPTVPAINDSGEVTFLGSLVVGSGSPVTTVDTDTGLWSELGGTGIGILMREGDIIPGFSPLQVGAFASGAYATAKTGASTGEATFSIQMKNGSTDTAILRASITGANVTAVGFVARENTPAPGSGENFNMLNGSFSDPQRMDATGNVAFAALTKPSNKEGIWYQPVTGGTPVKAFVTGDTAPGTGGATFKNIKSPAIGSAGVITFRGLLNNNGDNAGGLRNDGIWRGTTAGGFTNILLRGDSGLPGMPGGSKVGNVWHSWLTNLNHGAWRGWLDVNGDGSSAAPADVNAIYTDLSGAMSMIVKVGDIAPGMGGVATFSSFDLPVVGGAEQMAFIGNVTGGGTSAANNSGIWRSAPNGGALTLVIRTGDTITTTQGARVIQKVDFPGSGSTDRRWEQPVMDATGRLLVFVTFTSASGGGTSQILVP